MSIRIGCDCGYDFNVKDDLAGKKIRCPQCADPVDVPGSQPSRSSKPSRSGQSSKAQPSNSQRRSRPRDEEDDYDDRPARRTRNGGGSKRGKNSKKSSGSPALLWGGIGGGVLVVAAVAAFFLMSGDDSKEDGSVANNDSKTDEQSALDQMNQAGTNPTPPSTNQTDHTVQTNPTPQTPPGLGQSVASNNPPQTPTSISTPNIKPDFSNPITIQPRPQQPINSGPTTNGAPQPTIQPSSPNTTTPTAIASNPPSTATTTNPTTTPARERYASLADLIEVVEPSIVRLNVLLEDGTGIGSGFVIDKQGTVVTNYHVVEQAVKVAAHFADGSEARVLGFYHYDQQRDLAVIKIERDADKLHPLPLVPKAGRKGEKVVTFGNPLGLEFSSTEGIISSSLRPAKYMEEFGIPGVAGDWVQFDASISGGNSGGPLVNMKGEVVGVNTMTLTIGQNLNFAISAGDISKVYSERGTKLKDISPENLPKVAKPVKVGEDLVTDERGTERGKKLLAELNEITFVVAAFALDPTRRITDMVYAKAEGAAEKANLTIGNDRERGFMLVLMDLEDSENRDAKAGTQQLVISAHVLIKDQKKNGQFELVTIWGKEEKVGTVSISAMAQGIVPRQMSDKVGIFFRGFVSDFRKAQRAANPK